MNFILTKFQFMKRRTSIAIAISVIFTLFLTLAMVAVPAVAFAAQSNEVQIEPVNSQPSTKTTETLKKLVNDSGQKADKYLTLGNIYKNTGRNTLAEERYKEAIELAKAAEAPEVLVIAKARLAEVEFLLGKIDEAEQNRLFKQIKAEYEALREIGQLQCVCDCGRGPKTGYIVRRAGVAQNCNCC